MRNLVGDLGEQLTTYRTFHLCDQFERFSGGGRDGDDRIRANNAPAAVCATEAHAARFLLGLYVPRARQEGSKQPRALTQENCFFKLLVSHIAKLSI
ncbi:hypothetical protein [Kocuria marina]|uniref:hypothetical protein n=1 Tax=Kocuria marina TaxID=223184 RepID=UPI0021B44B2C|nr:hypothetical protein [Kocuria indica]